MEDERMVSKISDIKHDSNYYKIFLSKEFIQKGMENIGNVERLRLNVEKLTSVLSKVNIKVSDSKLKNINLKINSKISSDTVPEFTIDFNLKGLDSLIEHSLNKFDKTSIKDWEEFGVKIDSLAKTFERKSDSLYKHKKQRVKK